MSKFAHSAIFVGLLTLAAAAPAYAQTTKADDTTMAEAKQRFAEGIKFADAGDNESARLKFNQAWSLLKSPAILYNLARAEQLSNHPVEALEHYRLFGKMSSDPKVTEQQKQRATQNLAELSKKVGQIDIEAAPTAKITIDGKGQEWSTGGDPIPVLPGKHVVASTLEGNVHTVTVECEAGTVTKARLNEPQPPPQPQPLPKATPIAPTPLASTTVVEPPAEPSAGFWTTGRAVGAGLVGAGILTVGAGVLFQLKANSLTDDATKIRNGFSVATRRTECTAPSTPDVVNACKQLKTKSDDLGTAETLRTAFLVGGGALVVGGAVLFLVSPPKGTEPARGMRVVPYASASDAGVRVFGQF